MLRRLGLTRPYNRRHNEERNRGKVEGKGEERGGLSRVICNINAKLSSHGELSDWEVQSSNSLSLSSDVLLVLGQLSSDGSSLSSSKINWLSGQGVLGAVLGVEFLERSLVLEGILEFLSVLLVNDGQVSGDGLSYKLTVRIPFKVGSSRLPRSRSIRRPY